MVGTSPRSSSSSWMGSLCSGAMASWWSSRSCKDPVVDPTFTLNPLSPLAWPNRELHKRGQTTKPPWPGDKQVSLENSMRAKAALNFMEPRQLRKTGKPCPGPLFTSWPEQIQMLLCKTVTGHRLNSWLRLISTNMTTH